LTIGIDVSKKTFDAAYAANAVNAKQAHAIFANDLKGFKAFAGWLKEQGVNLTDSLVCLENTGIYHRSLAAYLLSQKAFVWVETPVQIKWSLGIQRGKNDSADSVRICTYAFRNQDKALAFSSADDAIGKMADLMALRTRLITIFICRAGESAVKGDFPIGEGQIGAFGLITNTVDANDNNAWLVRSDGKRLVP